MPRQARGKAAGKRRAPSAFYRERSRGWDVREQDVAHTLLTGGIVRSLHPRKLGGGSLAIGSAILAAINVRPGDEVRITLERGAITIRRAA